MTTPTHTRPAIDDPGELIAALPGLLTFRPADSVVVVTYTGLRRIAIESVMRLDIPDPEHIPEVASQLRLVVRNQEATLVDLIVLGGGGADPPHRLPARELVEEIARELGSDDIGLCHAVWAPHVESGQTWWCYEDPLCTGQVRDPSDSAITAALTVCGAVTFGSREELAALLAPDPEDALARRAALLAAGPPDPGEEAYQYLKGTIDTIADRIRADPHHPIPDLDDTAIARLAAALSTPDIRETCLAVTMSPRAHPAELLWTVLTRATPGPARADPASLLGVSSYLRGDGALAAIALEAAHTANPDHRLTQTLRHVLDYGLPPRQFRTLLAESFVAAFANR